MRARRRCSSVAYSCRLSPARARARWRACSRLREKLGKGWFLKGAVSGLLLFHDALEWMLVLTGEVHHLSDFGFRHLVGEHATLPDSVLVNVQHDPGGVLPVLVEETLEHMHHELHGGVVVVQEENAVQVRTFRARLRLRDDGRAGLVVAITESGGPGTRDRAVVVCGPVEFRRCRSPVHAPRALAA